MGRAAPITLDSQADVPDGVAPVPALVVRYPSRIATAGAAQG